MQGLPWAASLRCLSTSVMVPFHPQKTTGREERLGEISEPARNVVQTPRLPGKRSEPGSRAKQNLLCGWVRCEAAARVGALARAREAEDGKLLFGKGRAGPRPDPAGHYAVESPILQVRREVKASSMYEKLFNALPKSQRRDITVVQFCAWSCCAHRVPGSKEKKKKKPLSEGRFDIHSNP